jgi:Zn-dependent peptidase ImmA (M78 family)/DNA-binding XRE family transcriptional regulator
VDKLVNPEMLILAREARGMSQTDLARALSVTQGKISKYENGMLRPSAYDLDRISRLLKYTPEFFYQKDKVYGLSSTFLFHRQRKQVPVRLQRKIQAQVNILRMQIDRLFNSVEAELENRFELLDIDAYDGHADRVADVVRAAWQLPLGPIANVTAAVESAGGIILKCAFDTPLVDAAHLWLAGLPPLFFVNEDLPGDRLRWTLAHEIGHAVMHRNPTGDVEGQADRFASQFLMPKKEILRQLDDITLEKAAALKPVWKVSMAALVKRAFDLGKISESKYRRLFTSLSAQGFRTNEPFPIPVETPQAVRQLVTVHRQELGYNDFDLAELLFAPDPQFFTEEKKPTLMRVGGRPFFAFFTSEGPEQGPDKRLSV